MVKLRNVLRINFKIAEVVILIKRCKICGNMEKNIKLKKTIDTVEDFDPIESSLEGN